MQTKIKRIRNISLVLILFWCAGAFQTVGAQTIPFALEKKTALSPVNRDVYRNAAADYEKSRSKEDRNRLIFLAVSQIDVNFRHYQRKRRIGRDLFQTLLDILEIGASSAISITNGERAKSIIGESLTFLQGSRASVNKNLRLLEMQILFNKMIEKRSEVLVDILDKANLSNEQYPFDRAYIDIIAYFNAGTWDFALSTLATDSGAAAQAAEQLLEKKREAGLKFAPTQEEVRISNVNLTKIRNIIGQYYELQTQIDAEKALATPNAANIKTAEDKQKKILNNLRVLFALIEGNSELSSFLAEIPEKYGRDNATFKAKLEASLRTLTEDMSKATIADFDLILPKLSGVIVDNISRNPASSVELQKILDTYKP